MIHCKFHVMPPDIRFVEFPTPGDSRKNTLSALVDDDPEAAEKSRILAEQMAREEEVEETVKEFWMPVRRPLRIVTLIYCDIVHGCRISSAKFATRATNPLRCIGDGIIAVCAVKYFAMLVRHTG